MLENVRKQRSSPPILGVKLQHWAPADQAAWQAACQPGGRLARGGLASHMKPVTQTDLARRYGLFLDYLRRAKDLPSPQASDGITPANVAGYIEDLRLRVSSVTLQGSVAKLCRMAAILQPDLGWAWLRELANDLALDMTPASKFSRIVEAPRLVAAGLRLMQQAEGTPSLNPVRQAEFYRNGLMIALLACCPIRLRNFASLTTGDHLLQLDDSWHIKLTAQETKERRADERILPGMLSPYIDRYLAVHRPVFQHNGSALWVGRTGSALRPNTVARIITETTRKLLGKAISPHLFRSCAASTAYELAGDQPYLAAALLNHRSPEITERHYNRARSATFAKRYGELLRDLAAAHPRRSTSRSSD